MYHWIFFSIHFIITLHSSIAATSASQCKEKLKLNKMQSILVMSCNFMSCNFMPCNFDGPSFSAPPGAPIEATLSQRPTMQQTSNFLQPSEHQHVSIPSHKFRARVDYGSDTRAAYCVVDNSARDNTDRPQPWLGPHLRKGHVTDTVIQHTTAAELSRLTNRCPFVQSLRRKSRLWILILLQSYLCIGPTRRR